MNQTLQLRCGGVPMAQNNNTQARCSFRKRLGALALLAALVMFGGKAWGQVTWSGDITAAHSTAPYIAFIHYTTGTTITITDNVRLKDPLTVNSGETLTIQTDGGGPYTISWPSNYYGYPNMFSPIMCGYNGGGTLTINGGIVNGNNGIIINGNASGSNQPCIIVTNGGRCTLTNVTIQGNKSGGAISNNGTLTCTNCLFESNENTSGGAISNNGTLTCNGCQFKDNKVGVSNGNFGGGILNNSTGTLSCSNCTFTGNRAFVGGGICSYGKVTVTGCTFTSNTASGTNGGNGGGFYQSYENTNNPSTITSCEFNGNKANAGGAIFSSGYLRITEASGTQTLIHDNEILSGGTGGGGIFTNGTIDMEAGKIYNNATNIPNGGGVYVAVIVHNGDFRLKGNSAIYSNTATGYGGGVYVVNGASFTMSGNSNIGSLGSNSATRGGGIYSEGTVSINGGLIANNTSSGSGGGVYVNKGTCSITGGTIGTSGNPNTATTNGGGVFIASNGTVYIDGGDIEYNTASGNGGGVCQEGTLYMEYEVHIRNNTVSGAANNVYLSSSKLVTIDEYGLECGSYIGIKNRGNGDQIVNAIGTNAIDNCRCAYRNEFFHDDNGTCTAAPASSNPFSTAALYFTTTTPPTTWASSANASGCTISGGYVTHVNTAAGLAYFAKDVKDKDYTGKTVLLTADLDLSGSIWDPIGLKPFSGDCAGNSGAFEGTFNGQGHTIYGLNSTLLETEIGLFGYVTGTIKNLMVHTTASGLNTSAAKSIGGIVGELNGGTVYNCMAIATVSSGSNRGALVGKITSGSVKNCYAISNAAAAGSGSVTNCYVRKASGGTSANMGTATNVGSSTTGTFTAVETTRPYSYNCFDNQVGSTPLLTLLNQWVDSQNSPADLAHWTRATTSLINGDYPILMMPGHDAVASDGQMLHYGAVSGTGNLLSTYTTASCAICLYNSVSNVDPNSSSNAEFYINEDVAIGSGSNVNAHVGITLKDGAWHMFSPAIAAAPLGITYTDNNDYAYGATLPEEVFNNSDGYFPQTDLSGNNYYNSWDYYCYYEPEYHWINFKRNGNSHHHEDGNHEHINYQATPSASVNVNETTLIPGKGYLVGTRLETFLQSEGTLNDGTVTIAVTKDSPLRTGYNFIGNPYQAYLDFDAFANLSDNSFLWGGSTASYRMIYGGAYHTYAAGSSINPYAAPRVLHPHQGFMIVTASAGTVTFDNTMRVLSDATNAPFRGDHTDYPLVNLIVTSENEEYDLTTVELGRPDAGGALKQYDLHLGKGCIYTHYEDADYAIAFTRPGLSEIGIRFEADEETTFTMTWDMENGEFSYLHLIDNMTGSDIDCLTATEYRFTSRPSDYKSRFKLVFEYTGIEEQEDGPSTGSGTFAFMMGDELVVNCGPSTGSGTAGTATLQMFDLMGRLVMQKTVNGTQTTIAMPEMTAGVYVLRLSDNNGSRVQKIVIE